MDHTVADMRIFLFVLLGLLLLGDTICTLQTKGRRGQGSSIDKLLDQMMESEEQRDKRIENKMDQAVNNLTTSVRQMHEKLKAFIACDDKVSSIMKAKFDSISKQVSKLETSVTDAFNSLQTRMAKSENSKAHKIHQPADDDEEPEEDDEDSEESEKRAVRNAMKEPEEEISGDEDYAPPQPVKKLNVVRGRGESRGKPKGGAGQGLRKETRKWLMARPEDEEPAVDNVGGDPDYLSGLNFCVPELSSAITLLCEKTPSKWVSYILSCRSSKKQRARKKAATKQKKQNTTVKRMT